MIQLREARPDELSHVIDSWARSYARFSKIPHDIAPHVWHRLYRVGIRDILSEPDTRVVVATLSDLPDEVIGWVCWTTFVDHPLNLHYVFVKQEARRRGIASRLVRCALQNVGTRGYRATHRTWPWKRLEASLFPSEFHDPQNSLGR